MADKEKAEGEYNALLSEKEEKKDKYFKAKTQLEKLTVSVLCLTCPRWRY
jgi:hypothetical protein